MIYIYGPPRTHCYFIQIMKAMCHEFKQLNYNCEIIIGMNEKYIEYKSLKKSICVDDNKDTIEKTNKKEKPNNKNTIIIFGFHDVYRVNKFIDFIKKFNVIVYNSEQLHTGSWRNFVKTLPTMEYVNQIWDYSLNNIKILNEKGIKNTTHIPIGYSDGFVIDKHAENRKNDSILFIGNRNIRRKNKIEDINKLENLEEKAVFLRGVWGEKYNNRVRENTLFLNIHFYPKPILEVFRIIPLLCNGCNVLSEYSKDENLDKMLSKYVGFFKEDLSNFVEVKNNYVKNREKLFEDFKNEMKFSDLIKKSGILDHILG